LDKEHEGQIQLKCGHCPAFFVAESKLSIHRRNCEFKPAATKVNKKTVCQICGMSIGTKNVTNLRYHMEDYHGEQEVTCTVCGKVLKHPNSLNRHMASHRTYTCDICGKSGAMDKYRTHMLQTHTPEHLKPYHCELCGKGFCAKRSYKDHMNIHTGDKPYKCPFCPASFANQGTMGGHVRGTHKHEKRKPKLRPD